MKKKMTITQIAREAGVSIGTVDRALNNRPGINAATKKKVLDIAEANNYKPNLMSKALASRRIYQIAVITFPTASPFTKELISVIEDTAARLRDYNFRVQVSSMKDFSPAEQVEQIEQFIRQDVDGIAIEGLDDPTVRKCITRAAENGIKIVTFNSDLTHCPRLCFVGQDLDKSGRVAADILGKFMNDTGNVFVLHGSAKVAGHNQRVRGFCDVIESDFPAIRIAKIEESRDDERHAYEITRQILQQRNNINGIYVAATGSRGAGEALEDLGLARKVRLVCNDIVPKTRTFIRNGTIDATILQDPNTQGREPLMILFRKLFEGTEPEQEYLYTKIEILTRHML